MKLLKAISYVVLFFFLIINIQCTASKYQLQKETSNINPSHAYFQEWYGGVKVGGYGFNIYLANLNTLNTVTIDSVYFRRIKAKLVQGHSKYSAILKKPSKHYENISSAYQEDNKKLDKKVDFPFDLTNSECVISYIENGETKYLKIKGLIEKQSIYYEEGEPMALDID